MAGSAEPRPEIRAFLREIKEHPDDDTPRLVFADWLQEYGTPDEADRGELLRLQVLRHQLPEDDPRHDPLGRREMELQRRNLDAWVGPLVDHFVWDFVRGFLHLTARAGRLLSPEVMTLAVPEICNWMESLKVEDLRRRQAVRLVASPFLSCVHTLDLSDNGLRHGDLTALVRSPRVAHLRSLLLGGNCLGATSARTLANSPCLAGLTTLGLDGNHLRDEGAFDLADSPYLGNLTRLCVAGNRIGEEGRDALRKRFGDRVRLTDQSRER
jgi:uncharacterized protein (TIGR02996 family)